MPAIDDHCHVDVDNVTIAQRLIVRDAVADDVVDRGAERMTVSAVSKAGGNSLMVDHIFIGESIERRRADARSNLRRQKIEDFRRESSCAPHPFERFAAVDRRGRRRRTRRSDDGVYLRRRAGHLSNLGFFPREPSWRWGASANS